MNDEKTKLTNSESQQKGSKVGIHFSWYVAFLEPNSNIRGSQDVKSSRKQIPRGKKHHEISYKLNVACTFEARKHMNATKWKKVTVLHLHVTAQRSSCTEGKHNVG